MSQEHGKNPFTKEMRVVYKACVENKGPGITKRSLARIHKVLSDTCTKSPLASLVHDTAKVLESTDKRRMGDKVQKSVSRILDQLYTTMDDLLSVKKEDKAEVAAKSQLKRLLPTLLVDWEQADKGLQAAMAKYRLQPKFGRSRATVKIG
jgi:sigma54-dependent transcription regulator